MAILSAFTKSILNGSKNPAPTTGEMKSALGTVYDFITELLGTDSADKVAARYALGVPGGSGFRNLLLNPTFHLHNTLTPILGGSSQRTGVANETMFDCWRLVSAGQTVSFTNNGQYMTLSLPAGGIFQYLDAIDIANGPYQVSWEGTALCSLNGTAVSKNSVVTMNNNSNQSITFFGGTLFRPRFEPGRIAGDFELRPHTAEQNLVERWLERGTGYVISGEPTWVSFRNKKRGVGIQVSISGSATASSVSADGFLATPTAGNTTFGWTATAQA